MAGLWSATSGKRCTNKVWAQPSVAPNTLKCSWMLPSPEYRCLTNAFSLEVLKKCLFCAFLTQVVSAYCRQISLFMNKIIVLWFTQIAFIVLSLFDAKEMLRRKIVYNLVLHKFALLNTLLLTVNQYACIWLSYWIMIEILLILFWYRVFRSGVTWTRAKQYWRL